MIGQSRLGRRRPRDRVAPGDRRDEIAARLRAAVRTRIAAACRAAGRRSGEVTLIAVTKTYPVSDIQLLGDSASPTSGRTGTRRPTPKAAACAALGLPVTWHFVGQLYAALPYTRMN